MEKKSAVKSPTEDKITSRSQGEGDIGVEPEPFRKALLQWFDDHRRQLPWRGVDDPYAVWVSEVMLQQTRVATVIDYFERWMERFPTVQELAGAEVDEVLEMWSGLGYYRRARFLHRAAVEVVEEYDAIVPERVSELKKLPGIGPYTAGAIASIAFGRVEPVVDGNVMRVVTRLEAIDGDPRRGAAKKNIWSCAADWVDRRRPGDFNQGLMELGSQVCTARAPKCDDCPVRRWCRARRQGRPERYPTGSRKTTQRPMRGRCCVVHCDDGAGERRFLLRRRDDTGLLAGLWEFPSCEKQGEAMPPVETLEASICDVLSVASQGAMSPKLGEVTHVFSHRRLEMGVHELRLCKAPAGELPQRWRWVDAADLDDVASAALLQKIHRLWSAHR